MNDNPYNTPEATSPGGEKTDDRQFVISVGKSQRAIMWVILASIIGLFIPFAPIVTGILCVVFLYKMAKALKMSTASCVLLAIGAFIPIVGLIILLVVNSKATKLIRDNGIRVGLMGANRGDLVKYADA